MIYLLDGNPDKSIPNVTAILVKKEGLEKAVGLILKVEDDICYGTMFDGYSGSDKATMFPSLSRAVAMISTTLISYDIIGKKHGNYSDASQEDIRTCTEEALEIWNRGMEMQVMMSLKEEMAESGII